MTTTDAVECEQVVIAWSSVNILGYSGMGPVAKSDGWTLASSDRFAGLGESGRYLTESANALVGDGVYPPPALEFRPGSNGTLLLAKTYALSSGRGGHYQIHALRDATGRCSLWDLWSLRSAGLLRVDEIVEDLPFRLPPVTLNPAGSPARNADEGDVEGVALLLERLLEGRLFTIRTTSQTDGEEVVRRLLSVLPLGVARGVPVSTMITDPGAMLTGVAIVVPPFSQGFDRVDVDLENGDLAQYGEAALELASALLTANRREIGAMKTVAELQGWLALRRAPLGSLTVQQLRSACRGQQFPVLLQRLAADAQRGSILLRLSRDADAGRDFAAGLARHSPEYADVVAPLFGSSPGLAPADHGQVQDWLLDAIGRDQFDTYVLGPFVAEATSQDMVVDGAKLAQLLADSLGDRPELADFRFRTTTPQWTALTEHQVQTYLSAGDELPEGVWKPLRENPGRLALAIDRLVAGRGEDDKLTRGLQRWPDEEVDALVAAILRSNRLDPVWAVQVLEKRPPKVVRAVLATWWPQIAAHLGMPGVVVDQLEVRINRWWDKW